MIPVNPSFSCYARGVPEITELAGKGARTRQNLLVAAIDQFSSVGFRASSVPTIARTVGLTPSAVYAYFPSKQALLEAAADADVAGLILDALPDVLEGAFDGDFSEIFQRLLRALPDHPLARRLLSGEEYKLAERLALLPSEVRLQKGISMALRRGQENGTVRTDIDVDEMAAGLEAVVVALLMCMLQAGAAVDMPTSRAVLSVLDASIRPSTPPGR